MTLVNQSDTSVISYTLSNQKGEFQLIKIPHNRTLRLFITHITAAPFIKDFLLDSGSRDFGRISLASLTLNEVVISGGLPIRMNKDSLEYNTAYFKVRLNANVEELLKQLPGLQVNMNGEIYFQGRKVSAIRVNDKEFFNSDLKIASRNLDADLIKTVQIFGDRGNSKLIVNNEADLPVIINLKLKSNFLRSDFGKVYASGGTRSRYESGVLLNSFRDTLQVSLIGFANNINRGSFDYSELYEFGGLNRAESNSDLNFGGRTYQGVANNKAIGVNVNYDWKRTKANFMYMFNNDNSLLLQSTANDRFFDEIIQNSSSKLNIGNSASTHALSGLVRQTLNENTFLEIRPSIELKRTITDYRSESKTLTNDTLSNKNDSQISASMPFSAYRHSFKFETRFNKKHILSLQNLITYENGSNDERSQVNTFLITRDLLNQTFNRDVEIGTFNSNFSLSPKYQVALSKTFLLQVDLLFENSKKKYSQDLWLKNDTLTRTRRYDFENRYNVNTNKYSSRANLDWTIKEGITVSVNAAVEYRKYDVNYDNVIPEQTRYFTNVLPGISMLIKDLQIAWQRSTVAPSFSLLRTRTDNSNELQVKLPFYGFQNVLKDNWILNYRRYKEKSQLTLGMSVDNEHGSVGFENFYNIINAAYSTKSYLSGSTWSAYNYIQYFKSIRVSESLNSQIGLSPDFSLYQSYNRINSIENKNTTYLTSIKAEISLLWKNYIKVYPKYNLTYQTNSNTITNNSNFLEQSLTTYSYGSALSLGPIKGMSFEASYVVKNLPTSLNERDNINLLDTSLYYNFKGGSQIKLTGFDILDQNTATFRTAQNNEVSFQEMNVLKKYFLLGFVYKLKSTKVKSEPEY